ncbi:NAD(P)-binding protein [Lophiostoma macrostomum CBS 122681]|uniref:NAD(P)-binding protein n=1 Tax=Lophiostoma macrostomum CBS 122681 TaxID=1314788 RepID=A0A6A6T5R7_9PLEO|nr:NAD(P)-binding protein [Lophiostoma macrostomum CBS 122681]
MSPLTQFPTVLVTGGSGFVGYHIVRHLVHDNSFSTVVVLSRSAAQNTDRHVEGAQYISCDVTNREALQHAIQDIKPTLVIHAASAAPVTASPREFKEVTVGGTRNILELCKDSKCAQGFVYTSSNMVNRGREHLDAKEDHPLANTDPKALAYASAKANAEEMVLKANSLPVSESVQADWSGYLATGALRFPIVYGTHDATAVSGCLAALRNRETKALIGNGKNFWSYCSSQNLAESHLLLAQALLAADSSGVAGQAFNINDGEPRLFWSFVRDIWRVAGHEDKKDLTMKIPTWFALTLANVLEFVFWVFTFGRKRPGLMGRQQVEYCCFTHTYSIEKAKQRLGFVPNQNYEKILKESVEWLQDKHYRDSSKE